MRPLPYISKSRLKTYVTCPMKFYFTYILGRRGPPTFYTARGTEVHRAYENFYENVQQETLEAFWSRTLSKYLPGTETGHGRRGAADWADHMDPFIRNFLKFEKRRREAALDYADGSQTLAAQLWEPVAVEAEGWYDYEWNDPRWNVPLMGFADLIANSCTIPEVEADEGITIVDFKTGSVPDEQYREKGIFLEGEFYATIFENMDPRPGTVTAVAGYYPKTDTLIATPLSESRRMYMRRKLHEMVALSFHAEKEWFPVDEQPLCAWSNSRGDGMCDHYADCDSTWGLPVHRGPTYEHAIEAKPDDFHEQETVAVSGKPGSIYDMTNR